MRNKLITTLFLFGNVYYTMDWPRSNASTCTSCDENEILDLSSTCTVSECKKSDSEEQLTIVDKLEKAYDKMYHFLFQSQKICEQFNLWISNQLNIKALIDNPLSWNKIYKIVQNEYETFYDVLDTLTSDMYREYFSYKPESIYRFALWYKECAVHFRRVLVPIKFQCDALNENIRCRQASFCSENI